MPLVNRTADCSYAVMLFLCHSFSNKRLVDVVQKRLENSAYRCWRAPDVIPFGQHWCQNVVKAIHGAEAVVLLLTKTSPPTT